MGNPHIDSVDPKSDPNKPAPEPPRNPDLIPEMPPPVAHKTERTYGNPDPTPLWKIVLECGAVAVGIIVAFIYCGQLNQMIKSNKMTRRAFETDARPYVVVDNVWKANKPDKNIKDAEIVPFARYSDRLAPVVVELFYTVTGHTPAIGVRRHIRVMSESNATIAREAIEKFPTECPKLPEGNPPMSTGSHAWGDPSENLFKSEEIKRMVNDDAPMYVYGAIEYRDLFNGCHVTRFCFVEPVNVRCAPEGCFENCEWGNWLDDPRDVPQETHP